MSARPKLRPMTMPATDDWTCEWCGFPFLPGELASVDDTGGVFCGPSCAGKEAESRAHRAERIAEALEIRRHRELTARRAGR